MLTYQEAATVLEYNPVTGELKWQSYICIDSKQKYLGVYKYLCDAETARKEAEIKYGYHKNHGRTDL